MVVIYAKIVRKNTEVGAKQEIAGNFHLLEINKNMKTDLIENKIDKIVQDEAEKWMEERFGLVDGAIFNLPPMIIAKLKPLLFSYKSSLLKEVLGKLPKYNKYDAEKIALELLKLLEKE